MSLTRSTFKAAFAISEQVAGWLEAALSEADAALSGLARSVAGWKEDDLEGWQDFAAQHRTLTDAIRPLRQAGDPSAALLSLAPLKAAAIQADADALAARRQVLSQRQEDFSAARSQLTRSLDALSAFSEADAVATELAALRRSVVEATGQADRCAFDVADRILKEAAEQAVAATRIAVACRKARNEQWTCVVSPLIEVKAQGVGEAFATELECFDDRADRIQDLIAARQYDQATDLAVRFVLDIQQLQHLAARHQSCTASLKDLTARLAVLALPLPGAEADLSAAAGFTDARDYDSAVPILAALTQRMSAREAEAEQLAGLAARHTEAASGIAALGRREGCETTDLSAQHTAITALLTGSLTEARRALERLEDDIEQAGRIADQQAAASQLVRLNLKERDGDPDAAADWLLQAVKTLQDHPHSATITTPIQTLKDDIAAARQTGSRAALKEAGAGFLAASLLLERHAAFQKAAAFAGESIDDIAFRPDISAEVAALRELLSAAGEAAEVHLYTDADALLSSVYTGIRQARQRADAIETWKMTLEDADYTFEELWIDPLADKLSGELSALQEGYREAQSLGKAGKYAEGTALLGKLIPRGDGIAVKLDLLESQPDTAHLRALLKHPDGPKLLDEVVQTMGDDLSEAALKTVLSARFSMEVDIASRTDDTSSAALSLKHIYTMLQKVPESHITGNPTLKRVELFKNISSDSTYNYGEDSMTLRCGRPEDRKAVPLLPEDEADNIDPDCLPRPDVETNYFDWATLHEVGHSVDHKLGFMAARAGNPDFGGWTDHGADVAAIADVAAKALRFDADYIRQAMQDRAPQAPPVPEGVGEAEWLDRRNAVDDWCAAVRGKLWDDVAQSRSCAVGGRVYQQAYPGLWVSYPITARSAALSAYQFRSPIEWFAELYAGYHSGLLKEAHPAVAWMKEL